MANVEKTSVKATRVREKVVEAPKPVLRSDTDSMKIYQDLLTKAPDMPYFASMNEVTEWLDRVYRPWSNQVRSEVPK